MNEKIDVSVIIVNYNTKQLTENCIKSIQENTSDVIYEIILVDNDSSDGSSEYFQNRNDIVFVLSKNNLGFGRANNLGYSKSTGKYVFLLNSDTILLNNVVKIFYDEMEQLPNDIACIGAPLLKRDGKTIGNSFGYFPCFSQIYRVLKDLYLKKIIKNYVDGTIDFNNEVYPKFVDYIIGADLFLRRSVIEKHGLFDPDFFMYFEETEMQYRYHKNGYKAKIISGPRIIHLEPFIDNGKKKKYSAKHRYIFFEGMFLYYKKRYPFIKYILWRMLNFGFIPTIFSTSGTIKEKFQVFLLFLGIKTVKHWN